jgi:glucose-1-phosphatase
VENSIPPETYDAVIFDLGGVILPLYPQASINALSALLRKDAAELYTLSKQTDVFDQLERGEISPAAFRSALVRSAGASAGDGPISESALDEAWCAMLSTIPEENLDLLLTLKKTKRTFVLSNTNVIHVERFLADYARSHPARPSFFDHFEVVHFSHDLGMRKPEERIFSELIQRHQLTPERTLFLDDNHENVASAKKLGLLAVRHPTNAPLAPRFE